MEATKISVFGIGYVGAVVSACLVKQGHSVIAVDVSAQKIDSLNAGRSPIVEPGLDELIAEGRKSGRLRATSGVADALDGSTVSFVCVGTPSLPSGKLDLGYVIKVCEEIGAALARKTQWHSVVIRSTILPGTMRNVVVPALERTSGKQAGIDFGIAFLPEFLRESTAIDDYLRPSAVVIGGEDQRTIDLLVAMCGTNEAPLFVTDLGTAEAVKYANNAWHALKVSFANEIGSICKASQVDGMRVMEILCSDKKLNISKAYLKPGFAFGGSCLPKDLRAIRHHARANDVMTPLLDATLDANETQIDRAFGLITKYEHRRVGLLGLSFKADTDDLRESPLVELAERLLGKGFDLKIYDRNIVFTNLMGANRNFTLARLPHLASLLTDDLQSVIEHGETIVIGNADPAFGSLHASMPEGKRVVDFVRPDRKLPEITQYDGICW